jgi:hypothetical protein
MGTWLRLALFSLQE